MLDRAALPPEHRHGKDLTVRAAVAQLGAKFRDAGLPSAELDAKLLVLRACGLSKDAYILNSDRAVAPDEAREIASYEARRLAFEPVSRIIGFREFWGRIFRIGPAVLDPRPDTETLVEAALTIVREDNRLSSPLRILDLGVGSGCILLSLLAEIPGAWGVGADMEPSALAVARENARALALNERCSFVLGDWHAPYVGPFDLIVSNPPYIRGNEIAGLDKGVRCYDPIPALDGGTDGLEAYRSIAHGAARLMPPTGWIMLEAGKGQANEIVRIFDQAGWDFSMAAPRIFADLAGIERVVAIKRQASP